MEKRLHQEGRRWPASSGRWPAIRCLYRTGQGQRTMSSSGSSEAGVKPLVAFANTQECAEEASSFPGLETLLQVHPEPARGWICRRAGRRSGGSAALRRAVPATPGASPSWTCSSTRRSTRTPTTSTSASKDDGRGPRLRAAALCDLLLHLRGGSPTSIPQGC